jgi:mRNA-degrading endonuclease RelE of RelBE toxin-antitoxin system
MAAPGPAAPSKPPRTVEQSTRFGKAKRRLPPKAQRALDDEVKRILDNPLLGEMKTGALLGVRVVKFKPGPIQLLLAYEFNARRNVVELLDVGPHENFYRDLANYREAR